MALARAPTAPDSKKYKDPRGALLELSPSSPPYTLFLLFIIKTEARPIQPHTNLYLVTENPKS